LAVHRAWKGWDPLASLNDSRAFLVFWNLFSRALTLGVVLVGWVLFRAQSLPVAVQYLSRMMAWSHEGLRLLSPYILAALPIVILAHLVVHKDRNWAQEVPERSVYVRVGAYAGLVLLICLAGATDAAPFIYFQF